MDFLILNIHEDMYILNFILFILSSLLNFSKWWRQFFDIKKLQFTNESMDFFEKIVKSSLCGKSLINTNKIFDKSKRTPNEVK